MSDKEVRIIRKPVELRAVKGDDGGDVFSGYVFEWDALSDDLGGFVETVRRGAASSWIEKQPHNLFAVLDHEKEVSKVLGDTATGTLSLFEDDRGLGFTIKAGPTTAAKDAAIVVQRNKVGVSFGFIKGRENWTTTPDGRRLRELLEFSDLDDISIVVDAAYKSSDVSVAKRSLESHIAHESQQASQQSMVELLQNLLAVLRGIQWLYHTAHWQVRGQNFFCQHNMFGDLYWNLSDEYDTLAEKMVALQGESSVDPVVILGRMVSVVVRWCADRSAEDAALTAASELQATVASTYDALKSSGQLSAGLDDFLLGLANEHDTDVYWLQQAAKQCAPQEPPTVDYLRRCLDMAEIGEDIERRGNEHHDEDGRFHNGTPERMLSASQGRMAKAMRRHELRCSEYRESVKQNGSEHDATTKAFANWQEARAAHGAAIDAAEACIGDVTASHELRCGEHRSMIAMHRKMWASPEYANPAASAVTL